MASAIKSIQLVRSPQRIPTEKLKRFDRSAFGAVWTLIYVFTALVLMTTAIVVGLCLSLFDAARNERFDRQSKS
jgi:ABC-type polysaccharide/polyol phosphate export permease